MQADAPRPLEYEPAPQEVHPEVPVDSAEYVPTGQPVHPEVPMDSTEYVPDGQPVHTADVYAETTVEYAPGSQDRHSDPGMLASHAP